MTETAALAASARLFGRLLLIEPSEEFLRELAAPDVAAALAGVGVELRAATPGSVEELGAAYFEAFLNPETGTPPIQSLWTEGAYEGDAARALRALAEAAALEFDKSAARGAPVDHLGAILLLWAEASERAPAVAARLVEEHLAWGAAPLRQVARAGGFYGHVAVAAAALIEEL